MKKIGLSLIIAMLAVPASILAQQKRPTNEPTPFQLAQMQGIGPVIAGSYSYDKIPEKARKFISEHMKGMTVASVEREFTPLTYEITFSDGTEVDFDSKGEVVEFEVPAGKTVSSELLSKLLPDKAVKFLKEKGLEGQVAKIDKDLKRVEVDFIKGNRVEEMEFSHDGKFLRQE